MEIQSILNPYYNQFLNENYSGSNTLSQQSLNSGTVPPNTTVNDIITGFGNFLLAIIIDNYNNTYGTTYLPTDFGIVPMPNDQNSRCAYLVFPLSRESAILFRVYLELGITTDISFNFIKYVESPDYLDILG